MTGVLIWLAALLLYGGFRLWYDNWRGPLTPAEVEDFTTRLAQTSSGAVNDMDTVRKFLAADDGREFVMLNVVRVSRENVPDPRSGELVPASQALQRYSQAFVRALVRHGGHPAIVARKIGGYVDAWNVEPDPGWTLVGFMRYRSRRDMARLAADPRFNQGHAFKVAATPQTFSFPTQPRLMLFVSPRVWVGLTLALAAALVHLGVLLVA